MEIDVTKCRFYLDDGSCCSHDTGYTKCIHCYCDWKVHQEQLHRYKQAIEKIKYIINVEIKQSPNYWTDFVNIAYEAFDKIIQKCEESNDRK